MAQLYYRYSTMNAGKSIELIKVAYNYEERGKHVLTLVPAIDNRYGSGVITSRIGLQRDAISVKEETNILELFMRENEKHKIDCVLIDECQFLKKHHDPGACGNSWTAWRFRFWPTALKTTSGMSSLRGPITC